MTENQAIAPRPITPTSLTRKLFDLFVTPRDVFDEIAASPPKIINWLVPTALVCVSAFLWPAAMNQNAMLAGSAVSRIATTALTVVVGTIWSAFVLWIIGRLFLRSSFAFVKSLEVVGFSSTILILGGIVTGLLISICGNDAAHPALSIFFLKSHRADHLREAFDTLNIFHLWITALLAVGLSRLSGVSVKEAAFWTFGYWIVLRMALILLA